MTLRIAGEKGNSVELQVIQEENIIGSTKITREPGSPEEQQSQLTAAIDPLKPYKGKLIFDTENHISGGTPVWVIVDGVKTKIKTFNTKKNDSSSYHQEYEFDIANLIK